MNRLTQKNEKQRLGEEQQAAFEQLKAIFTTRPVLAMGIARDMGPCDYISLG